MSEHPPLLVARTVSERRPLLVARAPLRISFGGGGTDLPAYYERFGGFVVSAAIARYCYVVAAESADGGIHLTSTDYHLWEDFPAGEVPPVEEPLQLPKAAMEWFAAASPVPGSRGLRETGIDLLLASEVSPGTGLGSSSAMTVALVRAVSTYLDVEMGAAEMAELASWLEIERLNMPIGKQDQYASAFGGINAITFAPDGVDVQPLDLSPALTSELAGRLLLFSTGQSRNSAKILHQQRTDTGVKQDVTDSLHQLKALAGDMRDALLDGDLDGFGRLLDAGWQHKKRLSGMISSGDIDRWYEIARDAGALGGKITGAGGGGFLLLYCPPGAQEAVRAALAGAPPSDVALREMTFDFDVDGAHVSPVESESGATNVVAAHVLAGRRQRQMARPASRSQPSAALEMLRRT